MTFLGPQAPPQAAGRLEELSGESWYVIEHYDSLAPFLMSIVSDSDLWLFVSSSGGLTAGRQSAEHALFPYLTDDKVHEAHHHTGPLTILFVPEHWEPFSDRYAGLYHIQRTLCKHALGHQLRFEEVNHDLGLRFSYTWQTGERHGLVRRAALTNLGKVVRQVRLLDGLRNLLPHGTSVLLQTNRSTLLDAYKRNERFGHLATYSLSSHVVDRPEPAEALMCTAVWSVGLNAEVTLLSERQVRAFRFGESVNDEQDVRAERGAYLSAASLTLAPGETAAWTQVADVDQSYAQIALLSEQLTKAPATLLAAVDVGVRQSTDALHRFIGLSDGFQCTGRPLTDARHTANTLFNVMRGGMPVDQYRVTRADVERFVHARDKRMDAPLCALGLPAEFTIQALHQASTDDSRLQRLCLEYLPFAFSRRHGDPSRPWNRFSINVRSADGSTVLDYEGNWRDIFQNWEALALSYPAYVAGMICTFLNASTADGFNPYRITRAGVDWEVPDPSDPWSHIGYWGDHQVVYLYRLLLIARSHYPDLLPGLLGTRAFSYANVPYRIAPYDALKEHPHDTIEFDLDRAQDIEARVHDVGGDGKMVWDASDRVYLVTLAEKLLVLLCARMSNFIPGGGIWMNTQRPEWNDANNALVGWGVSMVTLYYLRPLLELCHELFACAVEVTISEEVASWVDRLTAALASGQNGAALMDALGEAGSIFRINYYERGFTGSNRIVSSAAVAQFIDLTLRRVDETITANVRTDGLYEAYNLLSLDPAPDIAIERLPLMLEGQVAALSSMAVDAPKAVRMLRAMQASGLRREDQHSYLLYPDRSLPRFQEKSLVPRDQVMAIPLLRAHLEAGDDCIVGQTPEGMTYFHPALRNAQYVAEALDGLALQSEYAKAVETDREAVLALYESVFDHKAFTGRSGTFFKYEGLGSIYWHMVSKLLLAVQEVFYQGIASGADSKDLTELADEYYELRAGIGDYKTPVEYGAIPTDPYSHTPAHAGAQQPGMTGQVKEDIIGRWNELGIRVHGGQVTFTGALLRHNEFLTEPQDFTHRNLSGESQTIALAPGTLAFTYLQVLVVYHAADTPRIVLHGHDGSSTEEAGLSLSRADSKNMFGRTGAIRRLDVYLRPGIDDS